DRGLELIVGLDDREARTRHVGAVPKGGDEAARQRGLADPERAGQCDHVAWPSDAGQCGTDCRRLFLACQDHREPRGIVSVTVVPLPFSESSSTVPPCASMNCCVSGRPSPSAASPRTPASTTRSKRLNTRGRSSGSIPEPLSLIRITACFLSPSAVTLIRPLRSV